MATTFKNRALALSQKYDNTVGLKSLACDITKRERYVPELQLEALILIAQMLAITTDARP